MPNSTITPATGPTSASLRHAAAVRSTLLANPGGSSAFSNAQGLRNLSDTQVDALVRSLPSSGKLSQPFAEWSDRWKRDTAEAARFGPRGEPQRSSAGRRGIVCRPTAQALPDYVVNVNREQVVFCRDETRAEKSHDYSAHSLIKPHQEIELKARRPTIHRIAVPLPDASLFEAIRWEPMPARYVIRVNAEGRNADVSAMRVFVGNDSSTAIEGNLYQIASGMAGRFTTGCNIDFEVVDGAIDAQRRLTVEVESDRRSHLIRFAAFVKTDDEGPNWRR